MSLVQVTTSFPALRLSAVCLVLLSPLGLMGKNIEIIDYKISHQKPVSGMWKIKSGGYASVGWTFTDLSEDKELFGWNYVRMGALVKSGPIIADIDEDKHKVFDVENEMGEDFDPSFSCYQENNRAVFLHQSNDQYSLYSMNLNKNPVLFNQIFEFEGEDDVFKGKTVTQFQCQGDGSLLLRLVKKNVEFYRIVLDPWEVQKIEHPEFPGKYQPRFRNQAGDYLLAKLGKWGDLEFWSPDLEKTAPISLDKNLHVIQFFPYLLNEESVVIGLITDKDRKRKIAFWKNGQWRVVRLLDENNNPLIYFYIKIIAETASGDLLLLAAETSRLSKRHYLVISPVESE